MARRNEDVVLPEQVKPAVLAQLAQDLAQVRAAIAKLRAEEAALVASLRDKLPQTGTYASTPGGPRVTMAPQARYSAEAALGAVRATGDQALWDHVVELVPVVNRERLRVVAPAIHDRAVIAHAHAVKLS